MTFEFEGHIKFLTKKYIFWVPIWIFYFPKTKNIALLKQENVFFHIIFNNKYTSYIFIALPICEGLPGGVHVPLFPESNTQCSLVPRK